MAKTYDWRLTTDIISGGYPNEEYGVIGGETPWETTSVLVGSQSAQYYFRDSASSSNNNSSRVVVDITESWVASIDSMNVLTVTVESTVNQIYRDDVKGSPGSGGSPYRDMYLRRDAGSPVLWSVTNDDIRTAHTINGNAISLGSYTFTLQPGQSHSRGSVYFRSNVAGHGSDPTPSIYVDEMWIGVHFRNSLPAPTVYTLNYSANGGSGAPSAQTGATPDGSYTFTVSSVAPTWGLYEFLGWSRTQYSDSRTEEDVEYRAGDSITLLQSSPTVTLYAVWRKDYRPGAVLSNGEWLSHNRVGGTCHVLSNTTGPVYTEMRTIGAPTAMGNPPSVYHDGKWYNMARIGLGGA